MVARDRLVHGNLAATLEDVAVRGGWSGSYAYQVDSVAFLALSGEGNRLTGHSFDTPDAVAAFREYFLQWWDRSEKLEDYVSRIRKVSA
jgi:hypothetical protein